MMTLTAIALTLTLTFTGTPAQAHDTYAQAMVVTELDRAQDVVTCTDATGNVWSFYGCEDYAEGDLVACIMDTMGTDTITDDAIIEARYTGYWVD